jgi:hypothetical protein
MTRPDGGDLRVVTTRLMLGYPPLEWRLLKYLSRSLQHGLMVVTTIAHDPIYLLVDYITSTNFKREPDGSKWTLTLVLLNEPMPILFPLR